MGARSCLLLMVAMIGCVDLAIQPQLDATVAQASRASSNSTVAFSAGLTKSRAVRTEHHTDSGQPAPLIPNLSSLKCALHNPAFRWFNTHFHWPSAMWNEVGGTLISAAKSVQGWMVAPGFVHLRIARLYSPIEPYANYRAPFEDTIAGFHLQR